MCHIPPVCCEHLIHVMFPSIVPLLSNTINLYWGVNLWCTPAARVHTTTEEVPAVSSQEMKGFSHLCHIKTWQHVKQVVWVWWTLIDHKTLNRTRIEVWVVTYWYKCSNIFSHISLPSPSQCRVISNLVWSPNGPLVSNPTTGWSWIAGCSFAV